MIDNGFSCICKNKFDLNSREPLILDCGHSICKECLQKEAH